ncbi:hypothetical protein [Leadbettera azotonutricia]|nr:hypothetical protein [Leadbettera azotonutricia]
MKFVGHIPGDNSLMVVLHVEMEDTDRVRIISASYSDEVYYVKKYTSHVKVTQKLDTIRNQRQGVIYSVRPVSELIASVPDFAFTSK